MLKNRSSMHNHSSIHTHPAIKPSKASPILPTPPSKKKTTSSAQT